MTDVPPNFQCQLPIFNDKKNSTYHCRYKIIPIKKNQEYEMLKVLYICTDSTAFHEIEGHCEFKP